MGKLAWYKAEPQAFLTATRGMPFELKCAYRLVIDLIYAHDARLPDDERFIAGQLGCDIRVWRRLRARLIEMDKLYVDGPFVRNARCDKEVTSALASLKQKRTAGLSSAEKRRKSDPEPSEGNGLATANVATEGQRTLNDYKSKRETLESNHEESESLTAPAPPPPDPDAATCRYLRHVLRGDCDDPGRLIGKWRRDYGRVALIEAADWFARVSKAEHIEHPLSSIGGELSRLAGKRKRPAAELSDEEFRAQIDATVEAARATYN